MPLEGDGQRAELARSVTLPLRRWPNNRLQRTAQRAAATPERWMTYAIHVPSRSAVKHLAPAADALAGALLGVPMAATP